MRAEQTSKVDNIIDFPQICSAFSSGEPWLCNGKAD